MGNSTKNAQRQALHYGKSYQVVVYIIAYHSIGWRIIPYSPLGRFSELDYSTRIRVPIPNGASSESSRRDVSERYVFRKALGETFPKDASSESSRQDASNAELFGTGGTIPIVEISTMETRPRGV